MKNDKKYRYSIFTFISTTNYESIKEIQEKDPNAEYILVTIDPNLSSDTWEVIYDKELADMNCSIIEKMYIARYIKLFDYLNSNICISITGAIQIKKSLSKLIDMFENSDYDVALMPHKERTQIIDELMTWYHTRSYPQYNVKKFIDVMNNSYYGNNYKHLFQLTFSIERNNKIINDLHRMLFAFMKLLSENENDVDRVDQTCWAYLTRYFFNNIKIFPLSEQILQSNYLQQYLHKSLIKHPSQDFSNLAIPDVKYIFNKPVICNYLI